MKFANKEIEKNIADQVMVVNTIKTNIAKLSDALMRTPEQGIVWDALIEKLVKVKHYDLPAAEKKLSGLYHQNGIALNNRVNRRNDLIDSMFTVERQIPA